MMILLIQINKSSFSRMTNNLNKYIPSISQIRQLLTILSQILRYFCSMSGLITALISLFRKIHEQDIFNNIILYTSWIKKNNEIISKRKKWNCSKLLYQFITSLYSYRYIAIVSEFQPSSVLTEPIKMFTFDIPTMSQKCVTFAYKTNVNVIR